MAQGTGQPKVRSSPQAPDSFFLKDIEAIVEFQRDGAGSIVSLVLTQGGQKLPGKKVK